MSREIQTQPALRRHFRTSLKPVFVTLSFLLVLALPGFAALSDPLFPGTEPVTVGIPNAAVDRIVRHVQTLVDQDEIVGGELLIIKDRKTVYRGAFGWQDREAQLPMEVGAVYCVRSMTKPLVGTAIQMLIDEGRLRLDTPVFEVLPFFDGPQHRQITIGQLLTHTAGLPLTTIGRPLADYSDLEEVVQEAANRALEFEPGSDFRYSDAGADTLGAIVARLTGMRVERFIQRRILDPLGMEESATLLNGDAGALQELLRRVPAAYSGGTGNWIKHWDASDQPIFPLFLPSQSLYSTTTDYARFLTLWMDGGRFGGQQLISAEAVERGLSPDSLVDGYPSTLGGLETYYAQQWLVRVDPGSTKKSSPAIFGHDGSDGTHAWAWPEQDLMVLFFTQSRGSLAGIRLERVLQNQLIDGGSPTPSSAEVAVTDKTEAVEVDRLTGLYWDETNASAYYVVSPHPRGIVVERPGRMIELFIADPAVAGSFVHETSSNMRLEFSLGNEGPATSMRTLFGKNGKYVEDNPRHRPDESLPSVDDVVAGVLAAHRTDLLAELGTVRLSGFVTLQAMNARAKLTTLFDSTHQRSDVEIGSVRERTVTDGERAWQYSTTTGSDELTGVRLEQARLDRYAVTFGDWREHYDRIDVLKRLRVEDKSLLLVRAKARQAPGVTLFVDERTGAVVQTEGMVLIPGIGFVGVQVRFEDLRDVGGMQLPFRSVATFASKQIGRVETRLTKSATGVEAGEDTFAAP